MESELITLNTTCIEVEWLKYLLIEIPLLEKLLITIFIHCGCK